MSKIVPIDSTHFAACQSANEARRPPRGEALEVVKPPTPGDLYRMSLAGFEAVDGEFDDLDITTKQAIEIIGLFLLGANGKTLRTFIDRGHLRVTGGVVTITRDGRRAKHDVVQRRSQEIARRVAPLIEQWKGVPPESKEITTDLERIMHLYGQTIAIHAAVEDATKTPLRKAISEAVWSIGRSTSSAKSLRATAIKAGAMLSDGNLGCRGASYSTTTPMREAMKRAGIACDWTTKQVHNFLREHGLRQPQVASPPPPTTPTPPAPNKIPSTSSAEVSALNMRILEDLAMLIRLKTEMNGEPKLNDTESLSVIERYTDNRKVALSMRGRLIRAGVLKGERTEAKDGSARWYDPLTSEFRLRNFKKDRAVLARVGSLTNDMARSILSSQKILSPEPITTPAQPPPVAKLAPELTRIDNRALIAALEDARVRLDARLAETNERRARLMSTRQEITQTLVEADTAIASTETELRLIDDDRKAIEQAIAKLG